MNRYIHSSLVRSTTTSSPRQCRKKVHSFFPALSRLLPVLVPLVGIFVHHLSEHGPTGGKKEWKSIRDSENVWNIPRTTSTYESTHILYASGNSGAIFLRCSNGQRGLESWVYLHTEYHDRLIEVPRCYRQSGLFMPARGPSARPLLR